MPSIRLVNLSKAYRMGRQTVGAVNQVDFEVPDGKIATLLGPSGCGKSTTLRCIAGLEHPDDGEIFFDHRPLFSRARRISVPPERRNVGMVFQSYMLILEAARHAPSGANSQPWHYIIVTDQAKPYFTELTIRPISPGCGASSPGSSRSPSTLRRRSTCSTWSAAQRIVRRSLKETS